MTRIIQVRFQWKDTQDPPQTQNLVFVTPDSEAISQITTALQNEVAPPFGEACNIQITAVGDLRST